MRRLRDAEDDASILNGEKSLRNVNVEKDRADESGNGDEKRCGTVLQDEFEGAAVESDDGVEGMLGFAKEPGLVFFFDVAKELGAHHGREREGDDGGNENGDSESDGEFAEEAADDIAHKEKRNQYGD